ncbi:ankyrin repeat domain-containing protein [Nostoc sp. FACHB-892]|uniref:ankyrin repeat domain-containing protein n=1 Tax=Nostoc sp. FACHB-892 TaxID=2692843 RepID=UPI001683E6A9|nr:ankyrin repeat domain-containing protein [Nostoc sp. FACHB-892]MBD2731102.1 ankyrin repeat domain-containing protein [Nostoc sp. FACHB-892]
MTEATNEPLLIAINEGNLEQVCALLDAGANPNTKDSQARHALVIAAELGSLDIVEVLLAADANLIIQGYDALWAAACNGHVDVVKALVAAGVPDSCTLVYAYEQRLILAAKTLMSAGVDFDWYYFLNQLLNAAITGNLEVINTLITIGINVDLKDHEKCTALMSASDYGQLEAVKLLVDAGADVNALVWKSGDNPFLNAADAGEKEVYDYLYPLVSEEIRKVGEQRIARGIKIKQRKQRKNIENFIDAAMMGQLEAVQAAIKNGIDINAIGSNGQTALMYAASYGHISVIKVLIKAGANLDILSDEDITGVRQTALMLVASSYFATNRHEVIKVLVEAGANINLQGQDGLTALMWATLCNYTNAVEALIECRADLNIRDKDGNTAIMYAKARKFDALVNVLKQAGASKGGLKEIELIEACEEGNIERVKNLIEMGVNINHCIDNMTPLGVAANHDEIALLLISEGANVNF